VELVVDAANVEANTIQADTELIADFFVAVTQGELFEDLLFSRSQVFNSGRCGVSFAKTLNDAAGDLWCHGGAPVTNFFNSCYQSGGNCVLEEKTVGARHDGIEQRIVVVVDR